MGLGLGDVVVFFVVGNGDCNGVLGGGLGNGVRGGNLNPEAVVAMVGFFVSKEKEIVL